MKNELKSLFAVFVIIVLIALCVSVILFFVGASMFWVTAVIAGGFVGALLATVGIAMCNYYLNQQLSEDCNCEIEDIYFAVNNLGWDREWIRENTSRFMLRIDREKTNRNEV